MISRRRTYFALVVGLAGAYLVLLTFLYYIPYDRRFDAPEAGTIAQWTGALLTGGALLIGAQALREELRAADAGRLEARLSEANSVAFVVAVTSTAGSRARIGLEVRNLGRYKIRLLEVDLTGDAPTHELRKDVWPQRVPNLLPGGNAILDPVEAAPEIGDASNWFEVRWTDVWDIRHRMRADALIDDPYHSDWALRRRVQMFGTDPD